jgi:hypothetical protein
VSAEEAGVLRAVLLWGKKATTDRNRLRLEVWNGDDGEGTCCRSGESASVPVGRGDRVDVHVILIGSMAKGDRQAFSLGASIEDSHK